MENENKILIVEAGYSTPKNKKVELKTPPFLLRRISFVEKEFLEEEDMILIDLFPNLDFSKLIKPVKAEVTEEDKHVTEAPSAIELEKLLLENLNLDKKNQQNDQEISCASHADVLTQITGITEISIDLTTTDLT